MFHDLRGRRALVTGASSGLGRHFARLLALHGAEVRAAARRLDKLEELEAEIEAGGGRGDVVEMDVTDSASVKAGIADADFDILINNAGIAVTKPALDMSEEAFDAVLATNLKGSFLVAREVAAAMEARGRGGAIVNIASITGLRVAGGLSAYATSKAAVIQLTRSMALEWARYGIRVNALCPGYIETDINRAFFGTEAGQAMIARIPQRRLGRPEDLDGALLLLASDAGAYITGATLAVDGGHLVSSL
ncbi:MAG: glucose 1-dehydrogenase [Paracoccaceae bacterium]